MCCYEQGYNNVNMDKLDFQKVRVGRSSTLTKYEPVASHCGLVQNNFVQ